MNPTEEVRKLLRLPQTFKTEDLDNYIEQYLSRKVDKRLALYELDSQVALLSNLVLLLSLHLKQNYLLHSQAELPEKRIPSDLLTRKEIAQRYKVDERTVSNWIKSGLEVIEIGGVSRISEQALKKFIETHKTKKFNWSSVSSNRAA